MLKPISATIITGFLGSGKTTLIRHILKSIAPKPVALIINEFGDIGVDRETLLGCGVKSCGADDIVELANGCICCTVADDFLPVMESILERSTPVEHIIIETSGLALPKPLIKAFNWPTIRTRVVVDGVITLVDAPAFKQGLFASDPKAVDAQRLKDPSLDHETPLKELFDDQLSAADLVVLNKTDALQADEISKLKHDLKSMLRKGVGLATARFGQLPIELVISLERNAQDDLDARPSHHDDVDGEHDHDDFTSFVIQLDEIENIDEWVKALEHTIIRYDILRIKGFIAQNNKPMRANLQAVGKRIQYYFDRPFAKDETRQGMLVIIAESGIDEKKVTRSIQTLCR
ncbi:MAG: cobalamin biosynthesis protein CobW, partial [Pseudomonadota bacterium]